MTGGAPMRTRYRHLYQTIAATEGEDTITFTVPEGRRWRLHSISVVNNTHTSSAYGYLTHVYAGTNYFTPTIANIGTTPILIFPELKATTNVQYHDPLLSHGDTVNVVTSNSTAQDEVKAIIEVEEEPEQITPPS